MDKNLLANQFTIFSNLPLETQIANIASLFDNEYRRESILNAVGQPRYILTKTDNSFRIELSQNRIDCFYNNLLTDKTNLKDFLCSINKINTIIELKITRLAINYIWWIFDENSEYLNTINTHIKLNLGKADELIIRTNNKQKIKDITFNIITTIQNNTVQNKQTFENKKSLLFHLDINNTPAEIIDYSELEYYFNEMLNVLNQRINFCKDLING